MPKRAGQLLFMVMMALFLAVNWRAYRGGYFHDDDLDNLAWTSLVHATDFATGLASPLFSPHHFRPAGHFYYWAMGRLAGLRFPWYVAVLHTLHLTNVLMLWILIWRLRIRFPAAAVGVLVFGFHAAVFYAYWRPMYIFDVLCTTFCLMSLLSYTSGKWVLSLALFWVAYKAKEQAVMLPLALGAYELWFGERRWKRLLPFFAVSLCFGLQGALRNPYRSPDDAYALRLAPAAVWKSVEFYSSRILFVPYAGLGLLLLPWFYRDRRVYFGLFTCCILLVPMLLLPNRLYATYLYLPLTGLATAFAALADQRGWTAAALFFAFWVPANALALQNDEKAELSCACQRRSYVSQLSDFIRRTPHIKSVVFSGRPACMERWGLEGALHYLSRRGDLEVRHIDDKDASRVLGRVSVALLTWNSRENKLYSAVRRDRTIGINYATMNYGTPFWVLGEGWFELEDHHRWTEPRATARLERPANANQFEIVVMVPSEQILELGHTSVEVLLSGRPLGRVELFRTGKHQICWHLPPGKAGPEDIEFRVAPPYKRSGEQLHPLGVAVEAFGFVRR